MVNLIKLSPLNWGNAPIGTLNIYRSIRSKRTFLSVDTGLIHEEFVILPYYTHPCPPALALKFFCVLCLKGIPSCLCLWRLLALCVWSTSNSGWSCCTWDKGPLCSGKCVQRCLRAVRKSAALLRVRVVDQCSPHYCCLWENFQEARRMRKIQWIYSPGSTFAVFPEEQSLLPFMLYRVC